MAQPAGPEAKILVIRNDKLGDFMLAWPALASLRLNLPRAHIAVLVPAYTAPLAKACSYVDEVILDPRIRGEWQSGLALGRLLKVRYFDAAITLFSHFDTGLAVWRAGIPRRYAPATKLAQIFHNRRIVQRRSLSEKPEYEYNLDLVQAFLADEAVKPTRPVAPPYLGFDAGELRELRHAFTQEQGIQQDRKLVFVHAGHGGSASNLSLQQYAQLIEHLGRPESRHVVLSAGPAEEDKARELSSLLRTPHSIYISREGLLSFAKHLALADVFISGSTGPLHLAAALDRPTAAFYPRRRSSTALRWQTVNSPERRLAFMPPADAGESEMSRIDVEAAAAAITRQFLQG